MEGLGNRCLPNLASLLASGSMERTVSTSLNYDPGNQIVSSRIYCNTSVAMMISIRWSCVRIQGSANFSSRLQGRPHVQQGIGRMSILPHLRNHHQVIPSSLSCYE